MELHEASRLAESLICDLGTSVSRSQVAGSIRRRKATVKDIEIVAIVHDYELLFERLHRHGRFIKPGVPDAIPWPPKTGSKYLRMLVDDRVKLDFFVATPDNWGALLMMRTGSATAVDGNAWGGFVPAMFRRWKRVSGGGKMVNCMPTTPDGLQLSVPEERDFFDILDVNWVEPENRTSSSAVTKKRG